MVNETIELQQAVAAELGYKVVKESQFDWRIVKPDGTPMIAVDRYEGDAWLNTGKWAYSVDAALELPIPDGASWKLYYHSYGRETYVCWLFLKGQPFEGIEGRGETSLAEAICNAWLAYRKAIKAS